MRLDTYPLGEQRKREDISASQREQLGERSSPNNSEEENWYAVYQILFPKEPCQAVPTSISPFQGNTALPGNMTVGGAMDLG